MEDPTEHSSSSNSVGQSLQLAAGSLPPSSAPAPSAEPSDKPRGRKRTRTQVSTKPAPSNMAETLDVGTTCGSGFITSRQPEPTSTLANTPKKSYQEHLWWKPLYIGRCLVSQKVH